MKSCLLWGIVISTIGFTNLNCDVCSCKKVPCPAFNDIIFSDWFPYQLNQKIIFRNQSFFDTITITEIDKSQTYDAQKGCYGGDAGCNMYCHIRSKENFVNYSPKLRIGFSSSTPFESTSVTRNLTFTFFTMQVSATNITDQGLEVFVANNTANFSVSLNLNGTVYNNVQTITKNTPTGTSNDPEPYKVYLSKGQGLVGYEVYPTNELWIKQ